MERLIWVVVVTFIGMLALGPAMIPMLKRLKVGQQVRDNGPQTHKIKQGTPTMGGLMFVIAIVVGSLLFMRKESVNDMLVMLAAMLAFGFIGFLDDWLKTVRKNTEGLKARYKLLGQIIVSCALSVYCYLNPNIGSTLYVPFLNIQWDIGIFYIPLMIFAGISVVNSVNLTDGVDGLLSGVTLIVMSVFALIAMFFWQGTENIFSSNAAINVMIFAGACVGACLGFLRFNAYPARLFMGDTGSFALGGAVLVTAMYLKLPLLIPILGIMYVISSLSVTVQRLYFKLTGGKRIIKMSPIHHHFELSGYSETQIVSGYMMVTVVVGLLSLLAF